jgi:hypothetical protein
MASIALKGLGEDDDEGLTTSLPTDGLYDIIPDMAAIASAGDATTVHFVFALRPNQDSAINPANYVITPPIPILKVARLSDFYFILKTRRLLEGISYTINASGVSPSN